MALLEILKYPDPRLSQSSVSVVEITPEIRILCEDMVETMYASRGVGLAAPQVGHFVNIIVIDESGPDDQNALRILINPEITLLGETIISEMEGCLSVPFDFRADVKRSERVSLRAKDLEGNDIDEEWSGFSAIVLQHEFDHLKGKLFIDHLGKLRRSLYDTRVKKLQKQV